MSHLRRLKCGELVGADSFIAPTRANGLRELGFTIPLIAKGLGLTKQSVYHAIHRGSILGRVNRLLAIIEDGSIFIANGVYCYSPDLSSYPLAVAEEFCNRLNGASK